MAFKKLVFSLSLMLIANQAQAIWGSLLYQEAYHLMGRNRQTIAAISIGALVAIRLWQSLSLDDGSSKRTDTNNDDMLHQHPIEDPASSDDDSDAHSITDTSKVLKTSEPLIFEPGADLESSIGVAFPLGWNTYPCFVNYETTKSLNVLLNSEKSIKLQSDLRNFKAFYFDDTDQLLILKANTDDHITQIFLYHKFNLIKETLIDRGSDHLPNLGLIEAIQITHRGEQVSIFTVGEKTTSFCLSH